MAHVLESFSAVVSPVFRPFGDDNVAGRIGNVRLRALSLIGSDPLHDITVQLRVVWILQTLLLSFYSLLFTLSPAFTHIAFT